MKNLFLCATLGFASIGLGCVTSAGGKLSDVTPAKPASPPAIEQTVGDFSFHLDGGKIVTSNKMGRELNEEVLKRWVASGYIRSHRYVPRAEFTSGSTFRLILEGQQEGESSVALQVLSALTLYTIPYHVHTQMQLAYVLENASSGCRFRASVEGSYDTVVGLLLLPVSPFFQGGRETTLQRVADNLYLQLAEQGAFDATTACEVRTGG